MSKKYGSAMTGPTIRVGGETLWLERKALRRGEMRLDIESVSQQCDGCGADIADSGVVHEGSAVIQCVCGATYPIVTTSPS